MVIASMQHSLVNEDWLLSATDDELVQGYQQTNDQAYVSALYQRHAHLILGACLKYLKDRAESEDAVMAIFEKIIIKLPQASVQSFNTWIFSVIRNECMSRLRKRRSTHQQLDQLKNIASNQVAEMDAPQWASTNGNNGSSPPAASDHPATKEEKLIAALERLSEMQRRCIQLFFFEEMSYRQIADATQLPMNQVKSHLQNGKRLLKRYIESA